VFVTLQLCFLNFVTLLVSNIAGKWLKLVVKLSKYGQRLLDHAMTFATQQHMQWGAVRDLLCTRQPGIDYLRPFSTSDVFDRHLKTHQHYTVLSPGDCNSVAIADISRLAFVLLLLLFLLLLLLLLLLFIFFDPTLYPATKQVSDCSPFPAVGY